jgi:hypothetical protein
MTYILYTKNTSVNVADISLNAVVPDVMEQAIWHGIIKKSELAPIWVATVLKFFLESWRLSHI